MRIDKLAGLATFAVVTLGVSTAFAQYAPGPPPPPPGYGQPAPYGYYPPPPPPGIQRSGLAVGGFLGLGSVGFDVDGSPGADDTYGGLGLGLFIGGSLNQQMQLLLDVWSTVYSDPDANEDAVHNLVTINLRYFPMPKLWVQLGLGFSYFDVVDHDTETVGSTDNGGVLMGAVGFDVFQGWSWSIDISARLALSDYDDRYYYDATTFGLLAGINWY
jgi:hypothetical protein